MRIQILVGALLFCVCLGASARAGELTCLPKGIKANDVVSVERRGPGQVVKRVTVGERLKQLKARCRRGKLLGTDGRQIYFYRLTGCWGNPPANYQDSLQRQSKELEKLKRRYTVIEMTCNPFNELIP